MREPIDVTGRWVGAYFQHGREHPITALFAQFDAHLQGKMTDGETDFESSVFDAAFEAGLPPGADEQIVAQLRKDFPDVPRGPIRAATHLPEFSILEGVVRGRTVEFVKRYLGPHFTGWKIGDQLVGTSVEGHAVYYSGRLSEDGDSLEGHWSVDGDAKAGTAPAHGGFLLRRQED